MIVFESSRNSFGDEIVSVRSERPVLLLKLRFVAPSFFLVLHFGSVSTSRSIPVRWPGPVTGGRGDRRVRVGWLVARFSG